MRDGGLRMERMDPLTVGSPALGCPGGNLAAINVLGTRLQRSVCGNVSLVLGL